MIYFYQKMKEWSLLMERYYSVLCLVLNMGLFNLKLGAKSYLTIKKVILMEVGG